MSSGPDLSFDVITDFTALERLPDQLTPAGAGALRLCALDLLSESLREAPVDEGTLRGSASAHFGGARVETGPAPGGDAVPATPLDGGAETDEGSAAVVFNTAYAAAQHERTDFVHPKGGKPKYLQDAATRHADLYFAQIAAAMARELPG
jgi:hypothetical protein